MTEFKFTCPACGQHMQAAEEWSGRQIDCPACHKQITIPAASKQTTPIAPGQPITSIKLPFEIENPGSQSLSASPSPPKDSVEPPPGEANPPKDSVEPPPGEANPPKDSVEPPPGEANPPKDSVEPPPGEANPSKKTPETPIPPQHPKPLRVALPAQQGETDLDSKKPEPATESLPPEHPEHTRVAFLSPKVKLDIVRAVRQQIADESCWLPGVIEGANAYAAKIIEGKTILVEVKNPEATHFSLIGAFLLEFHRRDVAATATGRRRMLDQEIVEAIREVLLAQTSEQEREEAPDPLANVNLMSISHPQCLAALDLLEERYQQRMEQVRSEKAKRKLGTIRMGDLVDRMEKKTGITLEDVATALYHELMDVRRRLDRIESRMDSKS